MKNMPQEVVAKQQQSRISHLEREIEGFKNSIQESKDAIQGAMSKALEWLAI